MVRRTTVLAAAFVAGCTVVGTVVPANAADETRRFMSGWLPYWSTETSSASFLTNSDVFSDISPFWHDARWDGSKVYIKNHLSDTQMTTALAKLRGQGVKILPSITDGSGRLRMAGTLASESKRTAHVQDIVNLVLAKGYDGIDLDYETFAFSDGQSSWSSTRPNWVAFVKELGAALHTQGKLLAVTAPPMSGSTGGYWVYDYAGIADSVDLLRIMAYDYSVGSPGPIAPLSWVKKVADNAVAIAPKSKIQLGIPVYGRNWFVAKSGKCPVGQDINDSNYSMTSGSALASLAKDGVAPGQITRDADSGEQTVSYSITYKGLDGKGEMTSCTVSRKAFFADATSVADRVKVARSAGLAGAALWTIGGETADQWPAVREAVGVVKDDPGAAQPASEGGRTQVRREGAEGVVHRRSDRGRQAQRRWYGRASDEPGRQGRLEDGGHPGDPEDGSAGVLLRAGEVRVIPGGPTRCGRSQGRAFGGAEDEGPRGRLGEVRGHRVHRAEGAP